MAAPRLDLDWEEGIFRGLLAGWRRLRPDPSTPPPHAARLADHERALTTLARLLAGEPLRVRAARGEGGVRGTEILLPPFLALAPDPQANRRLYVVRTAVGAAMRRSTRDAPPPEHGGLAPLGSLRVARRAVDLLAAELPRFGELHGEALAVTLAARPDVRRLRGRERALEEARQAALHGERPWEDPSIRRALAAPAARGPRSPEIPIWGAWILPLARPEDVAGPDEMPPGEDAETECELAAAPDDELRRVVLDPKEKEDAVLLHTFEKVETLDSYRGGARDTDGRDELELQLDALREVDLGDLIRGEEAAHSVLRSDVALEAGIPDVAGHAPDARGLPYDEWDGRRRRYRAGWCTVYPLPWRESDPAWARQARARHGRLIRDLRRRLEVHRSGRSPLARQMDGEEVDVQAVVERHAALRAGRGDDGRLYVRMPRRRRGFATTVLLDVSLSTDAWIEERRVLDTARDAVFVLGEVAHELGDRLQVLAFASNTRNRCQVWELKGWRESWTTAAARLGALVPTGYTRIGPALRHATDRLAAEPADRRLLLLVSDGKPTDYDRYEGRYGIADVRQALREAARREVDVHALAIDERARDTLPPMFGPGAWQILPHPDALPDALTCVYGRLTRR